YEEIIKTFKRIADSPRTPASIRNAVREQLTLHYYNAACSNSLLGDIERCKRYLKIAVQGDDAHFDNIEKDGDLLKLRKHESYKAFRRELEALFEEEDL
ncbi:MAG: hypothetical protein AAF517_11135, partial [Planctomycetota bacterium]